MKNFRADLFFFWRSPEKSFFFFGEHLRLCPWSLALASSIPVLGLESVCPRRGCPWPWPRALCPRLHLCILDYTDIELVTPKTTDLQQFIYSTCRSMNSFKALVGVASNGVIIFISKLYFGSTSDKIIVQKCRILSHFVAVNLILADKGFLIQNIVPAGVSVNIPMFLERSKFT